MDRVEAFFDLPYENHQGIPLAMDVYRPKEHKHEALPVIILIHGGGLVVGNRKMSKGICDHIAQKGFLVLVPEYRLCTETDAVGEISDACAGLRNAADRIREYGGDMFRISVIAESAGAFLAVYALASQHSEEIHRLIGFLFNDMSIKAISFISGMFYTAKNDMIGKFYPETLYGRERLDKLFINKMNPERQDVLDSLAPAIFITSQADFLRDYTLKYFDAYQKAGKDCMILDYPENIKLKHAFVAVKPNLPKSIEAQDKKASWILSA
ncbi:MAG: alpha/beta hydrolase [Erysipelotrichia bacterium]|nr:alpha/beta hydrolase [Erysipelotrichia bacterium]